jgi:hypothetical protein
VVAIAESKGGFVLAAPPPADPAANPPAKLPASPPATPPANPLGKSRPGKR